MYALFICRSSALTIENKLTFLGFIFVFSKPVEKTWRRTHKVRPYSQAVNPPQWPRRPFLSPPSILLLFCSPSPIYLVPPGLENLLHPPSSFLPPSLTLSFIGRLSSLSEADTSFVKADSHSFSRLLHAALCFMLRHVGCLHLSIYFNYVLIARRPLFKRLLIISIRLMWKIGCGLWFPPLS